VSGLAGFEVIGWNGFVAPKDTPPPVIARLAGAIGTALGDAEVRSKMNTAGYELAPLNTPEQFVKFIAADTEKWLQLAAKTNMKPTN
jgi:putative tricarboxylic transport membrane protein